MKKNNMIRTEFFWVWGGYIELNNNFIVKIMYNGGVTAINGISSLFSVSKNIMKI